MARADKAQSASSSWQVPAGVKVPAAGFIVILCPKSKRECWCWQGQELSRQHALLFGMIGWDWMGWRCMQQFGRRQPNAHDALVLDAMRAPHDAASCSVTTSVASTSSGMLHFIPVLSNPKHTCNCSRTTQVIALITLTYAQCCLLLLLWPLLLCQSCRGVAADPSWQQRSGCDWCQDWLTRHCTVQA